MADLFIAYEFPDPWASRMIDVDADFERLCQRLADKKVLVTPYGPVIYRSPEGADPQQAGRPVAAWWGQNIVSPVDKHGDASELMISVTDFVLNFLEENRES